MTRPPPQLTAETFDERLTDAVLAYLQASDEGKPWSADELKQRYPELADQLETFLDDQSSFQTILQPLKSSRPPSPVPESKKPGATFGRYELLEIVGQGGMGTVYKARPVGIQRDMALKMIRASGSLHGDSVRRFRNEIETIAALDHPQIVPILDVGEHDGILYYTMPLMEGSLASSSQRSKLEPRQAASQIVLIAGALHHAHQRGVLHRDLKPSNILLDRAGSPYLADFGLAKRLDADLSLTETGTLLGTPGYLAPEHAAGEKSQSTVAGDVYGLGAVLYHLLAGRAPFQGISPWQTLQLVRDSHPSSLRKGDAAVDAELEAICFKCLEKDPNSRYASAAEFADDLERYLEGKPVRARPVGRLRRSVRWVRRNPLLGGMAGLVVTLLLAGLVMLLLSYRVVKEARDLAEQRAAALKRRIYPADIRRAFNYSQIAEHEAARAVMAGYDEPWRPNDVRGFEWDWLRMLDARVPVEQACYRGHTDVVFHAEFSPDGKWIASGGADRAVHIWDAATAKTIHIFPADETGESGHRDDVNWLDFSPDGRLLATASDDGTVRLWDVQVWTQHAVFECGERGVEAVDFSSDGKSVVSGGHDGKVAIWDITSRSISAEVFADSPVLHVTFSADGESLVAGCESEVACWDVDGMAKRWKWPDAENAFCTAVAPSGRDVWVMERSGTVSSLDLQTGRVLFSSPRHSLSGRCIDYSPDGQCILSCGGNQRLAISSSVHGEVLTSMQPHELNIWSCRYSPQGDRIVTSSTDKTVRVWNCPEQRVDYVVHNADASECTLAWAGDSQRLAVATCIARNSDMDVNRLTIWEGATKNVIEKTGRFRIGTCWSPTGDQLYYSLAQGEVWVWDGNTQKQRRLLTSNDLYNADVVEVDTSSWLAVNDQRELTVFCRNGPVLSLDLRTGAISTNQQFSEEWLHHIESVSADEILAAYSKAVRFWQPSMRSWLPEHYPHLRGSAIAAAAVSPDRRWLAIGYDTGAITVIDRTGQDASQTFLGPPTPVMRLVFSPDGRAIFAVGVDGTIRLWHKESGEELLTLKPRLGSVSALQFSPDGTRLAIGGSAALDGSTVSLYTLPRPAKR